MPMFSPNKRPVQFPFVFHDVLREIARNYSLTGYDKIKEVPGIYPVLRLMNQDDYTPRPSMEEVKTKHLMKEVRRWNAFKAAIRREEGFWAREMTDNLKMTPQILEAEEVGRRGYKFVLRVDWKHDILTNLLSIT